MKRRDAKQVIDGRAARQHGLVERRQLLKDGVTRHRIDNMVKADHLRAVHRGVYRVGPVIGPKSWAMAATLACGPGSVIGGWSAVGLWELKPRNHKSAVDVLVFRGRARSRAGIRVRRVPGLRQDERTLLDGIPVTTVARTLCDIAPAASDRDLEKMIVEAFARDVLRKRDLMRLIDRHVGQPGISKLAALFAGANDPVRTRSQAEKLFLELVRRANLPMPAVNSRVGRYEVDFCWHRERLIVEVDGLAFHGTRGRAEADRARDRALASAGYRVMRVMWRQLKHEWPSLLIELTRALDRNDRMEPIHQAG